MNRARVLHTPLRNRLEAAVKPMRWMVEIAAKIALGPKELLKEGPIGVGGG
jgi:hypothetical protein